jgi:DnaJ-class molecular chaperone
MPKTWGERHAEESASGRRSFFSTTSVGSRHAAQVADLKKRHKVAGKSGAHGLNPTCRVCKGQGFNRGAHRRGTCSNCKGAGVVQK